MIDLSRYTYRNLLSGMMGRVSNVFDKREGGMIQTGIGPAAYGLEEFYLNLDQVQRSAYVQTAVGEALDELAVIAGLTRYPASAAVRLGIFDRAVPLGARFSTIDGGNSIDFVVTAAEEAEFTYQLTAETAGTIGNSYTGAILPITFLEGLKLAQLTDILIPGDDTETDEAFRERLITALNEKPFGGNVADYREFVGEIDGVGGAQIYPTWNGGGTVKVSVIGADWQPASAELVEQVQIAVDPPPDQGLGLGTAPIGAWVTVTAPTAKTIDVTATIRLSAGYELGQVKPLVEASIEDYLLGLRQNWAKPVTAGGIDYETNVYIGQVIAAIVGAMGVLNTTDVTLNDSSGDVILEESGIKQEIPVLGTVTLHVEA